MAVINGLTHLIMTSWIIHANQSNTTPPTVLAFTQEKKVLAKAGDVNKVLSIGIDKLFTCKVCLNAKA
jgi:hypothetical protein